MTGDQTDDELKDQCCTWNCNSVMEAKDFTCDEGIVRGKEDWHMPFGNAWSDWTTRDEDGTMVSRTEDEIKGECCPRNCYSEHQHGKYTCEEDHGPKKRDDMHAPWGIDWDEERSNEEWSSRCCEHKPQCYNWAQKGNGCSDGRTMRGEHDWHPFACDEGDDGCYTEQCCLLTCAKWEGTCPVGIERRGDTDMHMCPDKENGCTQADCCPRNCHKVMHARTLTCEAPAKPRSEHDGHDPFGGKWDDQSDEEIQRGCCQLNCHGVMTDKELTCDVGRMRGEHDFHMPWGNDCPSRFCSGTLFFFRKLNALLHSCDGLDPHILA